MKKLLISTLMLTSVAIFGAPPRAKSPARKVAFAAVPATPPATPVAPAASVPTTTIFAPTIANQPTAQIAQGFFINTIGKIANMKTSSLDQRFATVDAETKQAQLVLAPINIAGLSNDQKKEIINALKALWNEASDLISKESNIYYIWADNDRLKALKEIKYTIGQLVHHVSGFAESLTWKTASLLERRQKMIVSGLALFAAHRSGYLYTWLYNAFQPKAAAKCLFKALAPEQMQYLIESTPVKAAPVAKGWFQGLLDQ